jgi:hypothetical protein
MQRRRRSSSGHFHGYAMSWDLEFLEMIPLNFIFFHWRLLMYATVTWAG